MSTRYCVCGKGWAITAVRGSSIGRRRVIVAEHGGRFPRDPAIVRRLPGIGRYTAGAILSIAFDAREPILEANTLRLLSRLLCYDGDPRSTEGQRLLWAMAEALLPRRALRPVEPGPDGIGE